MDETLFLNDTREYSSKSHNFMQKLHHGFSLNVNYTYLTSRHHK